MARKELDCEFLSHTRMFRGTTPEEIRAMLGCLDARRRSYEKGEYIYTMGDCVDSLGLVLSGGVRIESNDVWGNTSVMGHVAPGFVFAEVYAAVPDEPLMVNVIATEDTEVLFLNVSRILTSCTHACTHHSKISQNLLNVFAHKNMNLSRRIFYTSPKTIRGKLLSYLSAQAIRRGSNTFTIPFNRQELADYLGVDRSALSMKIIKRNGSEVAFDLDKIVNAIKAANAEVPTDEQLTEREVTFASLNVEDKCKAAGHTVTVEEIQDMVEDQLMALDRFEVARKYIIYRYLQNQKRHKNTTDDKILSLIECNNEEVKQENSNKNPTVVSVQRDYMAGEVSKDLTMRTLLPADVVDAHEKGIIHFHDADYFAQHMHNCDLVNLEDMLQNGTVISGTLIERPHSFSTACNIATQIIAQVASCQYGGQSISLTHLAPFVDVSRKKIRRSVYAEMEAIGFNPGKEQIDVMVEKRLREEVARGVQTIQYQVVTLMTTNGQAPFITVFMYLNEARNEQEKADLALIIEEMLRQRHQGVKNEKGVWITPAFPKLIYVLEPDNLTEGTPYFYLTKLAAKCTAKRMVPDYISEKKMFEYKLSKGETEGNGDCYTCMGCRSFLTPDRSGNGYDNVAKAKNYEPGKPKYYGRFNQGVVTINLPDVALSSGRTWTGSGRSSTSASSCATAPCAAATSA